MPRYFFDLDKSQTKYPDGTGTELPDADRVPGEAIAFLAEVFKESSPDINDDIYVVSVRNEGGRTIFTTTLTMKSEWLVTQDSPSVEKRNVVLVVEDDPLSRIYAASIIANAGCDVVEANDADEAITILEARSDIGIIFTDIQMPGSMDGLRLARYVSVRWPPIRIIATSGVLAVRDGDLPQGGIFLSKPYTSDAVEQALHDFDARAA